MKTREITETEIDLILNETFDKNFWTYQLGMSSAEDEISGDNRFNFPFFDRGKQAWHDLKDKVANTICNPATNEPHDAIMDIVNGDARGLVLYVVGLLTGDFGVATQIAIPATALIIKTGIMKLCANN